MKYSEYLKQFIGKKGNLCLNENGHFFHIDNQLLADNSTLMEVHDDFVQLKNINRIFYIPINLFIVSISSNK